MDKKKESKINPEWSYIFKYYEDKIKENLVHRGLSKAQSKVAFEVIKGHSNKDIAKKLDKAVKTIKFHLTSIYKVLRIENRSQILLTIPILGIERGKK